MSDRWLHACAAFGGLFAVDMMYVRYTKALVARRYVYASSWATIMVAASGISAIAYVNDPVMLLPAMAGAFCGTYIGSKL